VLETWSLIPREEHRLRVYEDRVLMRISGSKSERVEGGWKRLHNDELHHLYSSPNIITQQVSVLNLGLETGV
jgi:hypothetical protein